LVIQVSEQGVRCGQTHGRAKFTDREIELMRQLGAEGKSSYWIAEKFGATAGYVRKVLRYAIRATTVGSIPSGA
jgi:DNA-binding CsgD family transcriptional regulator